MKKLNKLLDSIINNNSESKIIFHEYLTEKIQLLLERNIVNQDEINALINDLSQNATNDKVRNWLKKTFRKHILNNYGEVKPYQAKDSDPDWMKSNDPLTVSFDRFFKSEAREVVDYLNTIRGSINMNYNQARTAMIVHQAQQRKEAEREQNKDETANKSKAAESGTEVVKEYSSGIKWVNLTSKEALEYESHIMKHCVGDEAQGYISGVQSGRLIILSLRDKNNKPHVTIEIKKSNKIQQIKGKANSGVKTEYVKYVKDILKNGVMGIKFNEDDIEDLINIGIIVHKNGIWYDVTRLPNGLNWEGDLFLAEVEELTHLPNNLHVSGDLILHGTNITSLPKGLKVGRILDLNGLRKITSLPDDLEAGHINLIGTRVTTIPSNIKIRDGLNLSDLKLESLPDNLKVSDDINLFNSTISKLPKGLNVGGDLFLSNTNITSLPDDLKVGKTIVISSDMKLDKLSEYKKKYTILVN